MDVLERLRRVVAAHPDRLAVVAPDEELSFAELEERVAGVAARLWRAGVRRGSRVGVCLPRSAELPVALLAVWHLGAAFVALDPSYPPRRLHDVAADAGADVVYTTRPDLTCPDLTCPDLTCPERGGPGFVREGRGWPAGVAVVTPSPEVVPTAPQVPRVAVCGLDVAYVLYTSGSTGRPKGVAISRGGVNMLLAGLERAGVFPAEPGRVGWNASVAFDASVQQWIRICRGDTVVLLSDELRADPVALAAFVRDQELTALDVTPSHWAALRALRGSYRSLLLMMGGEPVPAGMWRELAEGDGPPAVNLYGPSECTVDATVGRIEGGASHIGRPLPGVRAYVLDERLRPAEEGELFLAG
ncbi:AMP-binding protein, partial [Microbispora amethystogenes]|uniref:AMP-binding protein n=1 Tax=Microbispora amethystogenes TaxID=1427754 RepID=UPI0033C79721